MIKVSLFLAICTVCSVFGYIHHHYHNNEYVVLDKRGIAIRITQGEWDAIKSNAEFAFKSCNLKLNFDLDYATSKEVAGDFIEAKTSNTPLDCYKLYKIISEKEPVAIAQKKQKFRDDIMSFMYLLFLLCSCFAIVAMFVAIIFKIINDVKSYFKKRRY